MKFIKKVLDIFLTIILINLITILTLSFNLKNILVDNIIKEIFAKEIININYGDNKLLSEIENNKEIKEILSSSETEELINKYFDLTINELTGESKKDDIDLEEDVIKFFKDNKEELSNIIGEDITDEMIDNAEEQLKNKNMTNSFKETLSNINNNMSPTEKKVLKGYQFFTSNNFRLVISLLIAVNLLLLFLLKKSLTKLMSRIGKSLIVSGIGLITTNIIVNYVVKHFAKIENFNFNNFIVIGIILIIVGLLTIIVEKIIKNLSRKENKNEVSQVSS